MYVDMVADLFHFGHVALLKQASAFGDYLLVGIMSDASVRANKRVPIMTMEERVASVSGCRYVNEVIPDAPWTMNADFMEQHAIDLVIHGDDYTDEQVSELYKVPISLGKFRTVPYTPTISTTEIIRRIKESG
ncbi:MAG: adenylyltransferase/cytidyltransferase family protein [Dehalococcoidia bacterium]|nr:adenylyltransferase/cytidyltransferase family protein [Dehalococcoidia bacterium]